MKQQMRNLKTFESWAYPPDAKNVNEELQRLFAEIQSDEQFQEKYLPEIMSKWFRHPIWGQTQWDDMMKEIGRNMWQNSGWYDINEWAIDKADDYGDVDLAEKLRKMKMLMMKLGVGVRH